jgi:hypothetical protein
MYRAVNLKYMLACQLQVDMGGGQTAVTCQNVSMLGRERHKERLYRTPKSYVIYWFSFSVTK